MLKKIPLKSIKSFAKSGLFAPKITKALQNSIIFHSSTSFFKYQNDPQIPNSLKASDFLVKRHIGPDEAEINEMLKTLSVSSLEELTSQVLPANVYDPKAFEKDDIKFPEAITEQQYFDHFRQIVEKNQLKKTYIGCGYYNTIIPAIIVRSVIENPVWYTPYTPYQAEISQGRLECLLYYQTMISELTGLPFSNCSLLDEGTAAAEAMFMAYNIANFKKNKFFVSKSVFPQTIDVVKTRAKHMNIEVIVEDTQTFDFEKNAASLCGALLQNPDNFGQFSDYTELAANLKKNKCTVIIAHDILALTLAKTPGEMGADIAIGSAQRFGVPLGYGGPSAAFFATTDEHKRKIPGRIIGISQDKHKNKVYRMAMQTREQHIRREKATSNICTSQALLANCSALYGIYHGPKGLKAIGERVNGLSQILAGYLHKFGYNLRGYNANNCTFFDTICINLPEKNAQTVLDEFLKHDINLRKIDESTVSISLDEATSLEDLAELIEIFASLRKVSINKDNIFNPSSYKLNPLLPNLQRKSDFMQQQIFNSLHSETQMLRFIRNISKKDISLAKSMIPLGSCTMKLNASSEMTALTWRHLSNMHPFVPLNQAQGYQKIIENLADWLKSITKFDAITFQPNSGAQGEYAGLLTINRYFEHRQEKHRNICLIPLSAHGTNPASAAMAGMKVVPVAVDSQGNINISDLKAKAEKHKDNLSTFMVTYPSTHGIYEDTIRESIEIIHQYGGQVYMDGANMNAQVGLTSPGFLGADVCHLNLHKTFCIPHGGGGPGMGPIGVKKHLAPFLPGHSLVQCGGDFAFGSVSSAPWSSASLLSISYSYIVQMGTQGLRKATQVAILNANYLEAKLKDKYKVLYRGKKGRVAHEFILDIRPIKEKVGISEEDIAKRLMDFGFHAPTMSFPVPGTLMIEPTESEDKAELDRFVDAFYKIREEIDKVADGRYDKVDNPLKNAPHTYEHVISTSWNHKYTREEAAFPVPWISARGKHWPSCGRIDNAYGDRNLICTCPDITEYL